MSIIELLELEQQLKERGYTPEQITVILGTQIKVKKPRKAKHIHPDERKRTGQKRTKPFQMNEVERMANALKTDQQRLLFGILIELGLRISDAIRLKVGDLRGRKETVLYIGKQKMSKEYELTPVLQEYVKTYIPKTAKDDDYLFPSREKNPKAGKGENKKPYISRKTGWKWISDAAEDVGLVVKNDNGLITNIRGFSCHAARKVPGTRMYENGSSVKAIQEFYGHKKMDTTELYLEINSDAAKRERRKADTGLRVPKK